MNPRGLSSGLSILVACFGLGWNSAPLFAYELVSPIYMETAQILPKGVRSPIYYNMSINIQDRLNGQGNPTPLGESMNRSIRWDDMLKEVSASDQKLLKSSMFSAGVDPAGGPGSTTGSVQVKTNNQVLITNIGIAERWMLSVALPIIQASINVDTGFVKTSEGQRWINQVCTQSVEECNLASQNLNYAVDQTLNKLGYQPLASKSFSALGDLVLMGRYHMNKFGPHEFTLRNTLILPTGRSANIDSLLDIPTGGGRYQVGSALLYDHELTPEIRFNSYGGFNLLLPSHAEKRVPLSDNSPLSADKELLTRNMSYLFSLGTSVQAKLFSAAILGAAYNFQYLTATHYSGGTQFGSDRYAFLDNLSPDQQLHSMMLSIGFSSIDWFLEKKFIYPFQAHLLYSRPIGGRNVAQADIVACEVMAFF